MQGVQERKNFFKAIFLIQAQNNQMSLNLQQYEQKCEKALFHGLSLFEHTAFTNYILRRQKLNTVFQVFIAVIAAAFAEPEPEPKADPKADPYLLYGGYYPYAYGHLGYYGYPYAYYGKRSAEPTAEPEADPKADPYLLYRGYYGHPYAYGYYGYPYVYGK